MGGRGRESQVPATLEYLQVLYRDWGWPSDSQGENERALAWLRLEVLESEGF